MVLNIGLKAWGILANDLLGNDQFGIFTILMPGVILLLSGVKGHDSHRWSCLIVLEVPRVLRGALVIRSHKLLEFLGPLIHLFLFGKLTEIVIDSRLRYLVNIHFGLGICISIYIDVDRFDLHGHLETTESLNEGFSGFIS